MGVPSHRRVARSPQRGEGGRASVGARAERRGMDADPAPILPPTRRLETLAGSQAGVVSRRQAYVLGLVRGQLRAQVRAGRWRRLGSQCVVLHRGPLLAETLWWAAVLEAGPRAHLDGATALLASGLRHWEEDAIRVSVPKGARVRRRRRPGLQLRETRRFDPDDVVLCGVPRTRPAVAALRGALWARSDRAASLLLTMAVQQGLCTTGELACELLRIRRDRRRGLLSAVVIDLDGGVRSLAELDVAQGCRTRGLPEPERQAVRRTPSGTYYLDARWAVWGLVVEIDGIQHTWAQQVVGDAVRHNALALQGDLVLRVPVLGLRVCPDQFFAQIEAGLRARGWSPDVLRAGRPDDHDAGRPD